jgi:hypothetical protein
MTAKVSLNYAVFDEKDDTLTTCVSNAPLFCRSGFLLEEGAVGVVAVEEVANYWGGSQRPIRLTLSVLLKGQLGWGAMRLGVLLLAVGAGGWLGVWLVVLAWECPRSSTQNHMKEHFPEINGGHFFRQKMWPVGLFVSFLASFDLFE